MPSPPMIGAVIVRHQFAVSGCSFLTWKYTIVENEHIVSTISRQTVARIATTVNSVAYGSLWLIQHTISSAAVKALWVIDAIQGEACRAWAAPRRCHRS